MPQTTELSANDIGEGNLPSTRVAHIFGEHVRQDVGDGSYTFFLNGYGVEDPKSFLYYRRWNTFTNKPSKKIKLQHGLAKVQRRP
jgi:hypothetical protein